MGGLEEALARKQAVRERVWRRLEEAGAARFPGAWGRIPNFTGAEAAADRLASSPTARPPGVIWELLDREKVEAVPVLRQLERGRG